MVPQTQPLPGPQSVKVLRVWPVQADLVQAPFSHLPEAH